LPFLKSLSLKLGQVLVLYGGWGLFVISFLDSSFVPFPVFNDLALMLLASRHPNRAFIYAAQSATGSMLGSYVIYFLARGGGRYLWRKSTPALIARTKRWLERNDFVTVLVACLLPPPAPFKACVLTAGILRVNLLRFGAALLLGRCLRFGVEAWLGAHYGPQAETYLKQNIVWASLLAVALVIVVTLVYRRLRTRRDDLPTPPSALT
jgi:membrane protein YqaA with SNARE-associated domain